MNGNIETFRPKHADKKHHNSSIMAERVSAGWGRQLSGRNKYLNIAIKDVVVNMVLCKSARSHSIDISRGGG